MKIIRNLAIGLLVVIALAAIGGIIFIKTMDFNRYRGEIATLVKNATGRDLTIAGDLGVTISLSPALVVDNVRLANVAWGKEPDMVNIKHLEAQMELMPLLHKEIRVTRILLVEPDILLEKDAAGNGNWVFSPPAAKEEKTAAGGAGTLPLPVIQQVTITNGRLRFF